MDIPTTGLFIRIAQAAYSFIKILIKPLWNLTIGPILRQSHKLYLSGREQKRWETLSHGLSYRLHLSSEVSSELSNDPNHVSILLIRNDGDAVVDRLEVCVIADSGNLSYPDVTVIPCLEPGKIASVRLNNIPVQSIWMENEIIRTSYDDFRIFLLTLVRAGKAEQVSSNVVRMHPTYTFLDSHWSRRWGDLYNTDAIECYKRDTEDRFRWYLCGTFGVFEGIRGRSRFAFVVEHHQFHLVPNVFLLWLLSRRVVLSSICWIALLLRVHVLRSSGTGRADMTPDVDSL